MMDKMHLQLILVADDELIILFEKTIETIAISYTKLIPTVSFPSLFYINILQK
jgi:hypothetical protein